MKKTILLISIFFAAVVFVGVSASSGAAREPLPALTLTSQDRILVIAPHPDDETIGAAGVIQEAVRLNIPVHVMYLTNGDSNPLAFLRYKKYPVLGKNQALAMGELRQKEAVAAMGYLGLREDQLIFLSYPDYGTLSIFRKFWQTDKPYRSALTRALNVPYKLSLSPGAGHDAQNILSDFKKVLLDVKPTKIFVTHPADDNSDHQAAYLFLRVALWDIEEQLRNVTVYTYLVHALNWPRPTGDIHSVENIQRSTWEGFELTPDNVVRKKDTVGYYRTQIPYKPGFLYLFAQPNELFAQVADMELKSGVLDDKAWGRLDDEQQLRKSDGRLDTQHRRVLRSVVYGLETKSVVVKIKLNQWSRSGFDINLYLFGYKKDEPFKMMPKYRVQVLNDHQVFIFDGQKRVRAAGVRVSRTGNDLYVSVPLALLNSPDQLISSANVRVQNWPAESSAWTVMRLNDAP